MLAVANCGLPLHNSFNKEADGVLKTAEMQNSTPLLQNSRIPEQNSA